MKPPFFPPFRPPKNARQRARRREGGHAFCFSWRTPSLHEAALTLLGANSAVCRHTLHTFPLFAPKTCCCPLPPCLPLTPDYDYVSSTANEPLNDLSPKPEPYPWRPLAYLTPTLGEPSPTTLSLPNAFLASPHPEPPAYASPTKPQSPKTLKPSTPIP